MLCSPAYASSLYPCDLTDAEWAQLSPLLPSPPRRGRPRCWSLRLLINALFYILCTGCAWRYLPRECPSWQTLIRHSASGAYTGSGSGSTRRYAARSACGQGVIPSLGSDHGTPECENHGRIRADQGL